MRRKGKRRIIWWLAVLLIVAAAILAWYFLGAEKVRETTEEVKKERAEGPRKEEAPALEKAPGVTQEIPEAKRPEPRDECALTEKDVREFFAYLNTKSYSQHLDEGTDTYDHFNRLIKRLSAKTPIPAGEGIDTALMVKNVFHFYRVLDKIDIRLLKEIIANEVETLELTLELFYKWLMLGDRCPDPEGVRPSQEVIYHYAGFFLNTIGGRAYLLRRPLRLRLLFSYYSLLIVHEADRTKKNSYGIDIFPLIAPLAKEISISPDFHFRDDYLLRLNQIDKYYLQKR
ncbi:MAG: hypothetical protein MUO52_07710 [Desulfobacterales bacterium]|nr:hypothetical protein [Desulfobacterales bacterium]